MVIQHYTHLLSFSPKPLRSAKLIFTAIILLGFYSSGLYAQCNCNGSPTTTMPGYATYEHFTDQNGDASYYNYKFQFPCMGDPCDVNTPYNFWYEIRYRELGETEWFVTYDSICVEEDLFLTVYALKYCKRYEFQVSCPCPFPLWLTNPGACPDNFSVIWNVQSSPPSATLKIRNLKVKAIDFSAGTASFDWDDVPILSSVVYQPSYREKTNNPLEPYIPLPNVTSSETTVSGLDPCKEYQFRVRGQGNCLGLLRNTSFSILDFTVSNCGSIITSIENVTGISAVIIWESLVTPDNSVSYHINYWPTNDPNNVTTVNAPYIPFELSQLAPNTTYSVQITTDCVVDPQGPDCPVASAVLQFTTNCELHESNNSFATATDLPFNTLVTAESNIFPVGDVDFFKFVPDCDLIDFVIKRPGAFQNEFDYQTDLPFRLYHEDQTPYSSEDYDKGYDFIDAQGLYHYVFFAEIGKLHYIEIYALHNFSDERCYDVMVRPCTECLDLSSLVIHGPTDINLFPSQETYYSSGVYWGWVTNWKISGPAEILSISMYNDVLVQFTGAGEVSLTVTVVNCYGEEASYTHIIQVSGDCNIPGFYNGNGGWSPLQSYNYCQTSQYWVLFQPPGNPQVSWHLISGSATWTTSWSWVGTLIKINQSSPEATFRGYITTPSCNYFDDTYFTFFIGGAAREAASFSVYPNPVAQELNITPAIQDESAINELAPEFEVRLFNQYSVEVARTTGSIMGSSTININTLPPGNYSVRIVHGKTIFNQTIQKL